MKVKKSNYWVAVIFIVTVLLALVPMARHGIVGGYDPVFHSSRIQTLANNLQAGHFPNPIGLEYLGGLGYGVGFFYGNFWLYPFALLVALGLPVFRVYELLLIVLIIAACSSIAWSVNQLVKSRLAVCIAMPLYLLNNYYISVLYGRAAIGEAFALIFVPIILTLAFQLFQGDQHRWLPLGLAMAGLLVAHLLTFMVMLVFLVLTLLIFMISRKQVLAKLSGVLKAGLIGAGVAAVFLLPLIQQYLVQPYADTSRDAQGHLLVATSDLSLVSAFLPFGDSMRHQGYVGPLLMWLLAAALVVLAINYRRLHVWQVSALVMSALLGALIYSRRILTVALHLMPGLATYQAIWRLHVELLPLMVLLIAAAIGLLPAVKPNIARIGAAVFVAAAAFTFVVPVRNELSFVHARKSSPIDFATAYGISMGEYRPRAFVKAYPNYYQISAAKIVSRQKGLTLKTNTHAALTLQAGKDVTEMTIPKLYYRGYRYQEASGGKVLAAGAVTKSQTGLGAVKLVRHAQPVTVTVTYHQTPLAWLGWVLSIASCVFVIVIQAYWRRERQ